MLVLSRKTGEKLLIGDDIEVIVLRTNGNQVRIGIVAPKNVEVHREEVYRRIHEEIQETVIENPEHPDSIEQANVG